MSGTAKRVRIGKSKTYPSEVWETESIPSSNVRISARIVQRASPRASTIRGSLVKVEANATKIASSIISKDKKVLDRKMGGLSLPDVVRELLKERNVLQWDPVEGVYNVIHGENFETRFVSFFVMVVSILFSFWKRFLSCYALRLEIEHFMTYLRNSF